MQFINYLYWEKYLIIFNTDTRTGVQGKSCFHITINNEALLSWNAFWSNIQWVWDKIDKVQDY